MKQEENILNNHGDTENFLKGFPLEMPYVVPEGYFNTLNNQILNRIQIEEERTSLIPALNGIDKKMPNTIPKDYFENLKIKPRKQATIIKINYFRQIVAAAVIIGVLFSTIAIWNAQNKTDFSKEVSKIKTEDLLNHLDTAEVPYSSTDSDDINIQGISETQENLQLASDEDLQEYINDNIETPYNNEDI